MFGNLLNNAAKYTDPNGAITLTVSAQGDSARISGCAAAWTSGLALTRGLVELHGGTIESFSPGVGMGSEFVVRLPIAPPVHQRENGLPNQDHSAVTPPRRRMLVVDDNVDAAQTLAAILELHGHEVRAAYTGAEGLRIAGEWKPEVCVLDIGIPDLNGYELARGIRKRCLDQQPLLIACTGWGQQEDVARAREAGFDHHLVKPVDPDAVLRLLPRQQGARSG